MWNKLDEGKRKLVALGLTVAVLFIAYRFSFSHTIEAYQLHNKLQREASLQGSDAAYPHLNKKYLFYKKVLSGYEVKKDDMENKLWQTVSNIAISQQVKISYNPLQLPVDTASNHHIFSQQFDFKGRYFNLVKLLDSFGKSRDIGRAASLEITSPKSSDKDMENLSLRLKLIAIDK